MGVSIRCSWHQHFVYARSNVGSSVRCVRFLLCHIHFFPVHELGYLPSCLIVLLDLNYATKLKQNCVLVILFGQLNIWLIDHGNFRPGLSKE